MRSGRWSHPLVALLALGVFAALLSPAAARAQAVSAPTVVVGSTGPGSLYGLAKPAVWNGDLVIYAHGIVDVNAPVGLPTDSPALAAMIDGWLQAGFGVAYSSYDMNGYALKDGMQRTHQLKGLFASKFGVPNRTFLVGHSLGGLIVLMLAERYPDQYDGVLPACGVVGGTPLEVQYVGHARALMDFLFPALPPLIGTAFDVKPGLDPDPSSPLMQAVLAQFLAGFGAGTQPLPYATLILGNAAALPGAPDHPLPGDPLIPQVLAGTGIGIVNFGIRFTDNILKLVNGKMPFDNSSTVYHAGFGGTVDAVINAGVARYTAQPAALNYLAHYYAPTGDARIPTLTLHNYYDPAVPYIHEIAYAGLVGNAGAAGMVTQWTVPTFGHCEFTPDEMTQAFAALVNWVYTGQKPANKVF